MLDVRNVLQHRWWVLPLAVLLLGLISLRLQDLQSRVSVATADFVSLGSYLEKELQTGAASQAKFDVALHRLQAAAPSLSRLAAVVGLVTVFVALLGVRSTEIPWWVQMVTVIYALYCGVWTVLTAPLH